MRLPAVIGLLCLLCVFPLVMHTDPYWLNLFAKLYIDAMLGISMWPLFVIGRLTLAHAAFMGMGAYGVSLLMQKLGLTFWVALPVTVLVVCVIAYLFALPSLRLFGAQFTIATFALAEVLRLAYIRFDAVFGGAQGIFRIPGVTPLALPFLPPIDFAGYVGQYYLMLALLAVMILFFYRFVHSYLGLVMRSIHDSAQLARTVGVNVLGYEMVTFVVTAAGATVAGALYAVMVHYIEPDLFGFTKSIEAQSYVIVGGVGSVFGPLLGAAFLGLLPEYLQMARQTTPIITGSALILAMLFLPDGLMGLPTRVSNIQGGIARLFRLISYHRGDSLGAGDAAKTLEET